jgi:putative hemolysin
MVYKPLAGMMLAHEMFNKNYKTITMRVGEPIPYHKINSLSLGKVQTAKLLRRHLYQLAKKKNKKSLFETETTIDHPQERRAIKEELKQSELLGQTGDGKKIYLYDFKAGSPVMNEIGRLRELTFRQVGEGTGKKRDLDRYDRDYRHLVLWDENDLEIAGAYRLGEVKHILSKEDSRGIYSEELFEYDHSKMAPYFEQGIELGRSFVSPKYWGKRSLDYLWYGIGAYLKRYPEVRYLFGPVSLSNSYPELAKALIVSFYRHYFNDEQKLAKSRTPYIVPKQDNAIIKDIISGDDYEADFKKLRQQLAHMDVTVPTLYKQYSEVAEQGGVRFIDFNVDADFADCIDGLVMVDLEKLKPKKRARYLGE